MDRDRRQSMRVSTRLPCQWQLFASLPSRAELLQRFSLPANLSLTAELAELDLEISSTLACITDTPTKHALSLLQRKLDLVYDSPSDVQAPKLQNVVMSFEGMQLHSERFASPGSWLGVHLQLNDGFNFVERGQISHCTETVGGYTLGIRFEVGEGVAEADPINTKRLARYIMQQKPGAA
jgi:hypothetical protein